MRKLFSFGAALSAVLAVYACSSDEKSSSPAAAGGTRQVLGTGGTSATGGSRTGGGNSGVNPAACPTDQPNNFDSCTQNGLECEYGNETCTCGPGGGPIGPGGQGGQGNLRFRCQNNPSADCVQGGTCTPGAGSNCTATDGSRCFCQGGFGRDAGNTGTYQCFNFDGGFNFDAGFGG